MVLLLLLLIALHYSYQQSALSLPKSAYFSNETCSAVYYKYSYEQCKWLPQRCDFHLVYFPRHQVCGYASSSEECTKMFAKLQATVMWILPPVPFEEQKFCYTNGKASGEICSFRFTLCHDYRPFLLRCDRHELFDGKSCRGYDSCRPKNRSVELHTALKEPEEEDIPEFTCCGKRDGFYALFSCSRNYIRCIRGKNQFKSCMGNDRFSPITKKCEKQEKIRACGIIRWDDRRPAAAGSLERARQRSNPSDFCMNFHKGEPWDETYHALENSFGSIIHCIGRAASFRNKYFPKEFPKHHALSIAKWEKDL